MKLRLDLLIFGQSGIGKTALTGRSYKVPEMAPVLMLSPEQDFLCLYEDNPDELEVDWSATKCALRNTDNPLQIVRVDNWMQLYLLIQALRKDVGPFKTIVLDSLTRAMEMATDYATEQAIKLNRGTPFPAVDYGSAAPGQSEYGTARRWLSQLVRDFKFLPVHSIATALYQWDREEFTKQKRIVPMMDTKMRGEVGARFSLVLYYTTAETKGGQAVRILRTQPDDWQAKGYWSLPDQGIQNPTMEKLYNLLLKKGGQ